MPQHLNESELLDRYDNDKAILLECIEVYFNTHAQTLEDIAKLVSESDYANLKKSLHKIKGTVACFTTGDLYIQVKAMEESVLNNEAIADISASFDSFSSDLANFNKELFELKDRLASDT